MAALFSRITEELVKKGLDTKTNPGRTWLMEKVRRVTRPTHIEILKDRESQRNKVCIGRMYFYTYDAKLKESLPYWDAFPLSIPIEQHTDGLLCLNIHYLPPKDRMILLTQLAKYATPRKMDERTRLKLSYPILKAAHQLYRVTPCIKKHLFNHIRSRFVEIPATEWDIAALLPTASFKGATVSEVYADSRKIIQERNP